MSIHYDRGAYLAKVTDYGLMMSRNDKPTFFLQFEVQKKVGADGNAQECQRRQGRYFKAVMDTTIGWLRNDLKAIGVEFEKPSQLDPQVEGAVNLMGREITVYCSHAEYQGEKREQWDLRQSGLTKLNADDIRKLDDLFGQPSKKPATQTPVRPNDSNDAI